MITAAMTTGRSAHPLRQDRVRRTGRRLRLGPVRRRRLRLVPTIAFEDGAPVGGITELEFDAGEQIRFRVKSDVADEVHVHGYDLSEQVAAGGTAAFDFPADIEGIFEVELEERVEQIAELRVNP